MANFEGTGVPFATVDLRGLQSHDPQPISRYPSAPIRYGPGF